MSGQAGDIREKIGRILATVEALDERMADRQRAAKEAEDKLFLAFRDFKHEMRQGQHVVQGRLELLNHTNATFDRRIGELDTQVKTLSAEFTKLRKPVDDLVSLRKRLGAMGIVAFSVITVLWAVFQQLWAMFGADKIGGWFLSHWK